MPNEREAGSNLGGLVPAATLTLSGSVTRSIPIYPTYNTVPDVGEGHINIISHSKRDATTAENVAHTGTESRQFPGVIEGQHDT